MSKTMEFILRPNGLYRTRNSEEKGRALVYKRGRASECRVLREGDVTMNPLPITFPSMGAFLSTPDPSVLAPKPVSGWSFLTGDNPKICVASEEEQFLEERTSRLLTLAEAE